MVREHRLVQWTSSPPVAVGSAVTYVARFPGRRLEYTYEIVELDPGERLVVRTRQVPFPMETTRFSSSTATHRWESSKRTAVHFEKSALCSGSSDGIRGGNRDAADCLEPSLCVGVVESDTVEALIAEGAVGRVKDGRSVSSEVEQI